MIISPQTHNSQSQTENPSPLRPENDHNDVEND